MRRHLDLEHEVSTQTWTDTAAHMSQRWETGSSQNCESCVPFLDPIPVFADETTFSSNWNQESAENDPTSIMLPKPTAELHGDAKLERPLEDSSNKETKNVPNKIPVRDVEYPEPIYICPEKRHVVETHVMPYHESLPMMFSWLSCNRNFRAEDDTVLTNVPYMGEDNNSYEFLSELQKIYCDK